MAIRYTGFSAGDFSVNHHSVRSGWRSMSGNSLQGRTDFWGSTTSQMWQPSALSRPGNLGTAYSDSWTENVTSPGDLHRPLPFKEMIRAKGLGVFQAVKRAAGW